MRKLMAVVLVAASTAGIVPVSVSAGAELLAGMPGEERFEASMNQLLEDANTRVVSEMVSDPTTADLVEDTNISSQKEAPREAISIDNIRGVPGDQKFETEFAGWLKQVDEQLKDELSKDPTGVGRTR